MVQPSGYLGREKGASKISKASPGQQTKRNSKKMEGGLSGGRLKFFLLKARVESTC